MRVKIIILISIILLTITSFLLTGCARYRDLVAGTVKEITGQDVMTPLQKAKQRRAQKTGTPVVEQETVKVPPLDEPPPPADYIVGPNDVLFINVSGKPEFSSLGSTTTTTALGTVHPPTGSRVDGSGNIQFPFLGTVQVGGMTLLQIQNHLRELLSKYIKEPWVVVEVGDYRSHPLYLLGQFRNSGTFYMDRPINLLQGIALGNGYDPTADLSAARLIRDKKVVPVDIYTLLTKGDQSQNVWLKPGDAIYIPDNKNQQVFVFGAVKKGGPVPIPAAGLNLAQAIASVELRDIGHDFRYIRIIRSLSTTRGELMVVDLDKILRGEALPLALKGGDIVYIPKGSLGTWNDAINEILPSLQIFSTILQPFVQIKYLKEGN